MKDVKQYSERMDIYFMYSSITMLDSDVTSYSILLCIQFH